MEEIKYKIEQITYSDGKKYFKPVKVIRNLYTKNITFEYFYEHPENFNDLIVKNTYAEALDVIYDYHNKEKDKKIIIHDVYVD